MILRNVVVAEEAIRLPTKGPSITTTETKPEMLPDRDDAAISIRRPIQFDEVIRWLDTQGLDVRESLATQLADELTVLRDRAITEGYKAGSDAAKDDVKNQFKSSLSALSAIVAETEQRFKQQVDELEQGITDIVGQALTKLVGPALIDPQATRHAVHDALQRVIGAKDVTLRLATQDIEPIAEYLDELAVAFGNRQVSIQEDPAVKAGGCIVDCNLGEIDARWETQLAHMVNTLRGRS